MTKNISFKLLNFCNGLVFFAPVATLLRTSKGVTLSQFFLLQALLSVMIFVFEMPTGILTDRIGYKKGILYAQILLFIARIFFLIANHISYFVVEAVLEAVSCTFMSGTSTAYLYEVCKESGEEERFMEESAKVNAWSTAGFIVSTVSYVVIYHWFSLNALVIATEIATAGSILTVAFMPAVKTERRAAGTERRAANIEYTAAGTEGKAGKQQKKLNFFNMPVTLWKFMLLDAGVGLTGLIINFMYVEKLGWSGIPVEMMTPIILIYSAFDLLIPGIMKKITKAGTSGAYKWISVAAGAMFIGIFAANNYISVVLMVLIPFLLNMISMIQYNYENEYIDELNQSENRATLLSMMNMGNSLLEIVFLLLSAVISSGQGNAMFLFAGAVMLFIALWGSRIVLQYAKRDQLS